MSEHSRTGNMHIGNQVHAALRKPQRGRATILLV